MRTEVWGWLPDSALNAPGVLSVVDGVLEEWAARWFRSFRLVRHRMDFGATPAVEPIIASAASLLVRGAADKEDILVGQALGLEIARLERTDDDEAVLDAFRQRLIADLVRTLETAFAVDEALIASASGRVALELRDEDGRKMLTIETTRSVLAQVRRRSLPAKPVDQRPLAGLEAAVADLPVALNARLGSSLVSLSEARRLAPGDVIMLDHALDAPFDLCGVEGTTIACATLVDTASPRALRLEVAPRRQH